MKIREAKEEELDFLVELWYESSCQSHHFIAAAYWEENKALMRTLYLPLSYNLVIGDCDGFISMMGNEINALFISPAQINKGLGTALVEWVKKESDTLTLNVYAQNKHALQFYEKMGFVLGETSIDEAIGEKQYRMIWKKNKSETEKEGST